MLEHIKRWNKWRKGCKWNGPLYKIGVLLGVIDSPTFALTLTDEEIASINRSIDRMEVSNE